MCIRDSAQCAYFLAQQPNLRHAFLPANTVGYRFCTDRRKSRRQKSDQVLLTPWNHPPTWVMPHLTKELLAQRWYHLLFDPPVHPPAPVRPDRIRPMGKILLRDWRVSDVHLSWITSCRNGIRWQLPAPLPSALATRHLPRMWLAARCRQTTDRAAAGPHSRTLMRLLRLV